MTYISPAKIAAFYRLVGGNYDALFLESPLHSIAFIYKSLGCYHSLQPSEDPFQAPSIPALTPEGFVRWQTVQLLLGPEEHVPYLQEAVKRFELARPAGGDLFPKTLPAECLPRRPDAEMCRWHEVVSEKLRLESEGKTTGQSLPHRPRGVGSDPLAEAPVDRRAASEAAAAAYARHGPANPGPVRDGSTASGAPQVRTQFRNLNFSSTYSPHTKPPDFGVEGPSPTSGRNGGPPYPKLHPFRHIPSRHSRSNISSTSSSSSSSHGRGRSPSPPRRSRHRTPHRNSSPVRSAHRSTSGQRQSRSPGHLTRPTEHYIRRHSSQGPYSSRAPADGRGRSSTHTSPHAPHGLSPHFFYAQPGSSSRPGSQAGPPTPESTLCSRGPLPAQTSQSHPLQQVRSAPIPQEPFPQSGYRYSIAGYGPQLMAGVGGAGPRPSREPALPEKAKSRSNSRTRYSVDAPLDERAEGWRWRPDVSGERPRDGDKLAAGRRRGDRAESVGRR